MAGRADYSDEQIREAVARAMVDDSDVSDAAGAAETRAPGVDPRTLFCQNWATVKQVLQFLKPFLPRNLQGIVDAIIRAGDVLKGLICR